METMSGEVSFGEKLMQHALTDLQNSFTVGTQQ